MPHLADEASRLIGTILNRISRLGNRRVAEMLVFAERLETIDERIASTQKSLDKFAKAIELYAGHLASHTSAIQELSRSAVELRESSAEQNRVLAHITESIFAQKERPMVAPPEIEETAATSEFVRELERRTREARKIKYVLQGLFVQDIRERTATAWEAARNLDNMVGIHYVDGCSIKRPIHYKELHITELN